MQRLERSELYELVWQVPMIELGKRYGVSRDAIRWACFQLRVPLPPQGYWGSLRAGKVMERPALQPLQPDQATFLNVAALVERDAPHPRQHIRRSAPKPPLVERIFGVKPSQPEVPQVVVPAGYKWHPSIQPIKKQLEARASGVRAAKGRYDWEQAHPGKSYPYRDDSHTSWEYFVASGKILDTFRASPRNRASREGGSVKQSAISADVTVTFLMINLPRPKIAREKVGALACLPICRGDEAPLDHRQAMRVKRAGFKPTTIEE